MLVLAACAVVYWFGLGSRPFASSEGHRVAPAWAMLESGDWWRVEMFEQAYLRKPPGMPWAIAGMSSLIGQSELSARSVSALAATLAALASMWFGRRWFGPTGGLAAGLLQATLPLLWAPGRSAEIEALNNLGAQLAGLALIDLMLAGRAAGRWDRRLEGETPAAIGAGGAGGAGGASAMRIGPAVDGDSDRWPRLTPAMAAVNAVLLGAGIVIAGLAKGPAAAPVLGGVLLGGIITLRSMRAIRPGWIVPPMAAAGAALWFIGSRIIEANPGAIRQDAGEFLWSGGAVKVLMMGPMALVSALPASLALLWYFGDESRREAASSRSALTRRAYAAAGMLAWGWAMSIVIMTVAGVSNPRYAMPAAWLLPLLCGWVARGVWGVRANFEDHRRALAKRLTFRNPMSWPVVLAMVALVSSAAPNFARVGAGSDTVGADIARQAPAGTVIWADGLIEARPDVLLYARQASGGSLRPLWKKSEMRAGSMPPRGEGVYIALRSDEDSDETERYRAARAGGTLELVSEHAVGRYRFGLYRVN